MQKDGISILSANCNPGGVRQIGRLLFILSSKQFVSKLKDMINEALKDLPERAGVNIHIFTGLCGATGSGIFLDVCYLVKYVIEQMNLRNALTFGYFFLPYVNMANHPTEYLPINGFAAMKELDYCMNYDNNKENSV